MSDTPGDSRGGRWVVALAPATLPSLLIYHFHLATTVPNFTPHIVGDLSESTIDPYRE